MSTTTTITATSIETNNLKKGTHYVELDNPIKEMPPVAVFFSFLDPKSKEWALKYNIVGTIRKHVPMGTTVSRFHSIEPYPKEMGEELTEAWAVARTMQVDDKVLEPLYEAIHGDTRIIDMQGIKAAFDYIGIDPLRMDREFGKVAVKEDALWQIECRRRLDIKTVPALVVSGRYLLKPEAFGDGFDAERVADAVKELLEL